MHVPYLKYADSNSPLAASNPNTAKALSASFFLPPPPSHEIAPDFAYPPPLPGIRLISRYRIKQIAKCLKPFKAPGPDGIPNIILTKSIDVLLDHLYFIFRALFKLSVYHDCWLSSTTLVLRKPGKPNYNVAKAYRPIALLDTIGKLLSTLVAADISHLAEKHSLHPPGQFGSRPGRNTSDSIHYLTHKIKDAWRAGKVAAALFLDVQGTFTNTVKLDSFTI